MNENKTSVEIYELICPKETYHKYSVVIKQGNVPCFAKEFDSIEEAEALANLFKE